MQFHQEKRDDDTSLCILCEVNGKERRTVTKILKNNQFSVLCTFAASKMSPKELRSRTKRSDRVADARSSPAKAKKIEKPKNVGRRSKQQPSQKQTVSESDAEVEQDREDNIFMLVDDCLKKVFSYLNMKDLAAVRDCCQRFRYLAEDIVQTKIRKKEFDERLCTSSKPSRKVEANMALMTTKFGKFIKHVQIDGSSKGDWRFGTMFNHCKALDSFKMRKVELNRVPIVKLENMLQDVGSLELISCWIEPCHLAAMLRATKKLKSFAFYGNVEMTTNLLSSLSELVDIETVRWKNSDVYDFTPHGFADFVKYLLPLKQLKNLEIFFVKRQNLILPAMAILATIDSLEELTLSWLMPRVAFFASLNEFPNLQLCKLLTYKEIPDEAMVPATHFTATKTQTLQPPNSQYGELPEHTTTLVRQN